MSAGGGSGAAPTGDGPRVSCIVPAFNSERYLAEALRSILEQTYRRIEVIVADDGSTDATREVAAGFGEPVRVVTQTTRQISRFVARPELGVSVTQIQHFWIPELKAEETRWRGDPRAGALPGYVTMTMLARRSVFDGAALPRLHRRRGRRLLLPRGRELLRDVPRRAGEVRDAAAAAERGSVRLTRAAALPVGLDVERRSFRRRTDSD